MNQSRRRSSLVEPELTISSQRTESHLLAPSGEKHQFGISTPLKNRWRFLAACLWSVLGGWNDGAPGCLLPYMESAYGLNYAQVSLIWIGSAGGFIFVALASHQINKVFNNRQIIICSCALMITMTAIVCSGTLFPVIVIGFCIGGVGSAMGLSQLNVILSNFENCPKYLGFFHGSYGAGATLSPILATIVVADRGVQWNYFYSIALGLMCLNAANVTFAFKGIDQDLDSFGLNNQREDEEDVGSGRVKLALQNYKTWLISLFLLFYQGLEVALGGFIVSYLIDYRSGVESKIGYVASGYWGGLTIGRIFLVPPVVKYLGLKRGGLIMSLAAIVFITLTWGVSNLVAESVFISLAGVFIGPTYPLLIQVSTKILPRKIQIISLTIMSSFGSSGGAIFPFVVGLVSDRFGSFVVLPVAIVLYVLALCCWFLLPNPERTKCKHWWERVW